MEPILISIIVIIIWRFSCGFRAFVFGREILYCCPVSFCRSTRLSPATPLCREHQNGKEKLLLMYVDLSFFFPPVFSRWGWPHGISHVTTLFSWCLFFPPFPLLFFQLSVNSPLELVFFKNRNRSCGVICSFDVFSPIHKTRVSSCT